ncbi:MAG: SRPBCC family protein [Actinomycetota bacterium]
MAEVERSRAVHAALDEVWALLADFGAIAQWVENVDHSCLLTEQTEGLGVVRRIQTGRTVVLERVTAWERESTLEYSIEGLPPVVQSLRNRWSLAADGATTRVAITSTVDVGPRPPQQVVARLIGRRFAGVSEQMLSGLAAHLAKGARA